MSRNRGQKRVDIFIGIGVLPTISSVADSEPLFFDGREQLSVYEWGLLRCKNVQEAANILLIEAPTANVARVFPVNIN